MNRRHYSLMLMAAVGMAAIAFLWVGKRLKVQDSEVRQVIAGVTVPALVGEEVNGHVLFGRHCAPCHGEVGEGGDKGPPLIHKIYEPSHHPDEAIYAAVMLGARAHHWQFGNMPKMEGVSERDIGAIVAFIRRVQSANGIN